MAIISECAFADLELLKSKEVVLDYSSIGDGQTCRFELPVFAYPSDTSDEYKNDFTTSLLALSNRYSSPKFYLEVETSCDTWSQVAQLNDSTYGEYFSTFTNQPTWIGYRVDWYKVYNSEGVGCYRIRQEYTDTIEATTELRYSFKYNLKLYSDNLADRTTKIRYTINGGKIGDPLNQKQVIDYKSNIWQREVRLPESFFGLPTTEYSREFVRYKNGLQEPTLSESIETYQLICRRLPYQLHRELSITMMLAPRIEIYDYNDGNPNSSKYNAFEVKPASNYEPTWTTYTPYAPVQLSFNPRYENNRYKRC